MGFFSIFSQDVAIDLGTANTLVWLKGKQVVLNEPTIVAYDRTTKHIIALGREANAMRGKTPKNIKIIRPMRDGAIADFEITEGMLRAFIRKVSRSWQFARRVIVCVPSGITEVEKRAVRDSCEHAGAREVHLLAEPMASAIGIGLDVHESVGNMIVDIGGGTTEIAVIALGGIVADESIRTAGDELTQAINQYFRRTHNLLIGESTAEIIKCEVGSAVELKDEIEFEVKGRDLVSGLPKLITISSADIRDCLHEPIQEILSSIISLLERTPPELAADILERGIMLTGGGALLKGLDEKIRRETKLPVHIAEDPLTAVVRGTGKSIDQFNKYRSVFLKNSRY
jgi:rod shape-determining protein MreB